MSDAPTPRHPEEVMRIVVREEGGCVAAFVAHPGTMNGAFAVATIRTSVAKLPGAFEAFKTLCTALVPLLLNPIGVDKDDILVVEHGRGARAHAANDSKGT